MFIDADARSKPAGRAAWLVLAAGAVTLFFSNGRWAIPIATWLYPLFMIRFMRRQPPLRGFVAVAAVEMVVNTAAWWGTASPQLNLLQAIPAGLGLLLALVFLLDRLLAPRVGGLAGTLVFPAAYALMEWLMVLLSPLGSIGMLAYTQFDNLPLIQLVSLTGTAGLSFLIAWFGSLANYALEEGFSGPKVGRALLIYGGVLALVLAYGGARLALAPRPQATVRIAGISLYGRAEQARMRAAHSADRTAYLRLTGDVEQRALESTLREAAAGARVVLWQECAIRVDEDPAPFIARAQKVARQAGVYLVVPQYITYPESGRTDENKLLILDPQGEAVLEHVKFGSAGLEGIRPGDGVLRTLQTPFGTLSAVICRDLDFPGTLRQAGRNGTGILLAPSFDWYEIDPFHARYAVFRAVENGVSLVRQVSAGNSLATDPFGRVLASVDSFARGEDVMVAQVPTQAVPTVYAYLGDWFDVVAAALFGALLWRGLRPRRQSVTATIPAAGAARSWPVKC